MKARIRTDRCSTCDAYSSVAMTRTPLGLLCSSCTENVVACASSARDSEIWDLRAMAIEEPPVVSDTVARVARIASALGEELFRKGASPTFNADARTRLDFAGAYLDCGDAAGALEQGVAAFRTATSSLEREEALHLILSPPLLPLASFDRLSAVLRALRAPP